MFGFKLVRQSKLDESEVKSLKKVLPLIAETADDLKSFAHGLSESGIDTGSIDVTQYRDLLNTLEANFMIYQENKFASPAREIQLFYIMEAFELSMKLMSEVATKTDSIRDKFRIPKDVSITQACEVILQNEDAPDVVGEISKFLYTSERLCQMLTRNILINSIRISHAIGEDLVRVKTDRDIVQDFYHRKKYMKPDQDKKIITYKLQYCINNNSVKGEAGNVRAKRRNRDV